MSSRLTTTIDLVAGAAMLTAACVVIWPYVKPTPPEPTNKLIGRTVSLRDSPHKGSMTARVGVIEYSDFECPYCGRFARDIQPDIEQAFVATDRVFWVFRHLPLVKIHKNALMAARASDCAFREGRFWELHSALFAAQDRLSGPEVQATGAALGLGQDWEACVALDVNDRVARDLKEASTLEIDSTPLFLVGQRGPDQTLRVTSVIRGAQGLTEFSKAIEKAAPR